MADRNGSSATSPSERGMTPVVANVLLVAVVVIVVAVLAVGAFALLGNDEVGPIASFEMTNETSGVVITLTEGDTIDASRLFVRVDDPDGDVSSGNWAALGGEADGGTVSAGHTLTLSKADGDETIDIVWEPSTGEKSALLKTWEGDAPPNLVTEISSCTTIDESGTYELTTDLTGVSQSPCIEITASDVTFTGDGHTIGGSGSFGIRATGGSNVVVKDVTLDGWNTAIKFDSIQSGTVSNVQVNAYDGAALTIDGGKNNEVTALSGSTSTAFNFVVLSNTEGNSLSSISSTGAANYGLFLQSATNNDIEDATLPATSLATVLLTQGSNDNTLTNIDASDSSGVGGYGLEVDGSSGNLFEDVTATDNANYGIYLHSNANNNEIASSTLNDNDCGVYIENSDDNLIRDSEFKSPSDHYEVASGTNNRFQSNAYNGGEDSTC